MKKTILAIILCAVAATSFSDNDPRTHYTYDGAGNRVSQYRIIGSGVLSAHKRDALGLDNVTEDRKHSVHIFQNSQSGEIIVSVPDYQDSDNGCVSIYSLHGQLVYQCQMSSSLTSLEIAGLDKECFIIKVQLNEVSNTWKVKK